MSSLAVDVPPRSQSEPQASATRPSLLPKWFRHPRMLFCAAVLPQILLLVINLRAFALVSGDLDATQRRLALSIFGLELALLAAITLCAAVLRWRRKFIPLTLHAGVLLGCVGYLSYFIYSQGAGLLPQSVAAWILPPGELLYYQFMLVMPAIFFSGVTLSCAELRLSIKGESVIVTAIILGLPFCWFVIMRFGTFLDAIGWSFVGVLVVSFACLFAAVTRVSVRGYAAVNRSGPRALAYFSFVVGVALPLAGLALNAQIPFPSDFQATTVYALALANGLVLLLPKFRHPVLHTFTWLAQCALFPFTLYFFVAFLPFLPLSLPAMIYLGAGFLVLTPTVLFFLHTQRVLDGYEQESRSRGRRSRIALGIGAALVLPTVYIGGALIDRVVLRDAIDYVYSPDYRQPDRFSGSRAAIERSLLRLRDFQAGVRLPFVSDFYNWAVFDNLVLPTEKIEAMHRAFMGTPLPAREAEMIFGRSAPGSRSVFAAGPPLPTPTDVALVELTAATVAENQSRRTTITLDLDNRSTAQSEFVTQIKIPEGVFVSGYWLKMGDERVPGRVVEKKAALWVYQKIRDVSRRDPGILVYTDPTTIELRVFPFAALERRQTEIEFLYPAALNPTIKIGAREWRGEGETDGVSLALTADGRSAVSVTPAALAKLPRAERSPYLHFIVDRSAAANASDEQLVARMRDAAAALNIAECLVTFANYEGADVINELTPVGTLSADRLRSMNALPSRGGFLPERAIKRALLGYHDRLSHATEAGEALRRFPVIAVLRAEESELKFDADMVHFARLAPDVGEFYVATGDGPLVAHDFTGAAQLAGTGSWRPIALLQVGDAVAPCRLDVAESQMVQFEATDRARDLRVLDGNSFDPLPAIPVIQPDEPYSRGVAAWQRYLAWVHNPSLGSDGLTQIVNLSRDTGILVAATSYIAVETSAQWKMLEEKERQKLRNHAALEIEQVPEPGTWALLGCGAGVLWLARRRQRRRSGS